MPDPLVGIVMGSQSDWETMRAAAEMLDALGVAARGPHRLGAPHPRPPLRLRRGRRRPRPAGDHRRRRRCGAPAGHARRQDPRCRSSACRSQSKALTGLDSLLSIVQMPKGVPVGTLAIGAAGAANAGLFAAAILATPTPRSPTRLDAWRAAQTAAVAEAPDGA